MWDSSKVGIFVIVQTFTEYRIHEALESGGPIRETERHDFVLEGTVSRTEGSEIFRGWIYPDPVKSLSYIELRKVSSLP
jgi:hypothetical protein